MCFIRSICSPHSRDSSHTNQVSRTLLHHVVFTCSSPPPLLRRCFISKTSLIFFTSSSPGVRVLVDAREKLHIPWGDQDNQKHGDSLMAFDTRSAKVTSGKLETSVFLQYLPAIKALWADSGIQNAFDRRREFQLVGLLLELNHSPSFCTGTTLLSPKSNELALGFFKRRGNGSENRK